MFLLTQELNSKENLLNDMEKQYYKKVDDIQGFVIKYRDVTKPSDQCLKMQTQIDKLNQALHLYYVELHELREEKVELIKLNFVFFILTRVLATKSSN